MESKSALSLFKNSVEEIKNIAELYCKIICDNMEAAHSEENEKKDISLYCEQADISIKRAIDDLNQILIDWENNRFRERMAINYCKTCLSRILQQFMVFDVIIRDHKRMALKRECKEEDFCCMRHINDARDNIFEMLKL